MMNFDRQIVVGLVFDLSLQHHTDTRRYLDIVKEGMISFATKLGLNCGIYVAHPDNHFMPRQQGESVASIASYSEQNGFRAWDAMLQCLDMISAQEADEKHIVVFTDRFKKEKLYQYGKAIRMNDGRKYGCKFKVIGMGDKYDRKALKELQGANCEVLHVDEPSRASQIVTESIIIGV